MEAYSSGEELLVKARKPYTITKQRERWTDEEHNRFLEALKLYGRAWQRIEEHIGTKTAVQIRSHAQKFFTKLEKEATLRGIPVGQAIDIEIPPPRPKRKPASPYPRKIGAVGSTITPTGLKDVKELKSALSHVDEEALDMEKEPIPEGNPKEKHHDGKCSFQGSASYSVSSSMKNSESGRVARNSVTSKEYVIPEERVNKGKPNESQVTDGTIGTHMSDEPGAVETTQSHGLENAKEAAKNFPRHVPVLILDGSLGTCGQAVSSDVSYQEFPVNQMGIHNLQALFANPTASVSAGSQNSRSRSSSHQKFPPFHPPFMQYASSQESYPPFLQMSSAFSSLIVSTLLQNPAAHAAASMAASYWPFPNMEASEESSACMMGGLPSRQLNPGPSMAALAAATVAAATAWWAAHGLLPMGTPFHTGFACAPASRSDIPSDNADRTAPIEKETEENNLQRPIPKSDQDNQEIYEVQQAPHSDTKTPTSLSDSGDSLGAKTNRDMTAGEDVKMFPAVTNRNDPCQSKNKQVDRSSCGSNTASSCGDVQTDALVVGEKSEQDMKEPNQSNYQGECSNRRNKSTGSINDSWKEVSEEGRMAFQALFLREVLPQSFSPPHDVSKKEDQKISTEVRHIKEDGDNDSLQLVPDNESAETCSNHHEEEKPTPKAEDNRNEGLLTIGIAHNKLKARRTGFEPYKKCSMEARESRLGNNSGQDNENGHKRLRMEGQALS